MMRRRHLLSSTARLLPLTSRKQALEHAKVMAWLATVLEGMTAYDRKPLKERSQ